MENTKGLAKYIAAEISSGGILDLAQLEAKINAALIVMSPPDTNSKKEVAHLRNKLRIKKIESKSTNRRLSTEVKFWKDKARKSMGFYEIQASYKELDEILEGDKYVKG